MASIGDRKKRFVNEIEDDDDFTDAQCLLPKPSSAKKISTRNCDLNLADLGDGHSKDDEEDNPDLIMFDDYDIPISHKSKDSPKAAKAKKAKAVPKALRENAVEASASTPKYDLSFNSDRDIPPYKIYLGRGISLELKEYRKVMYLGFQRMNDMNEVRNRFNVPLDQLPILRKLLML